MKHFQFFPKKYGFFPYVFLCYLFMPLIHVLNETGFKAIIGYALLLLFLLTYRQVYHTIAKKSFSFWLTLQVGIIMILSIVYNPYNLFMGFFPSNFIGWYNNEKQFNRAVTTFASAIILTVIILSYQGMMSDLFFFLPFLVVMIGAPFGIRSMGEKLELEQQLDQANDQIMDFIKREERVRIARDLHDTLGHTLSLITLQSQLVQRIAEKPERVTAEAKEIEMTARSALQQVRELVSDMRTITIAEELWDMEQILKAADIQFHMEEQSELPSLTPLQQNILGMCLREAVTNIVKHSEAENCFVTIGNTRGDFTISVTDDGVGVCENNYEGNGLSGMRERLALIEGKLSIESGLGTTVAMAVPIIVKEEAVVL